MVQASPYRFFVKCCARLSYVAIGRAMVLLIVLTGLTANAQAQLYDTVATKPQPAVTDTVNTVAQLDLTDVIHNLLHNQPKKRNDSIGTKPVISIVPAIGYTLVTRFALVLAGNLAFRTGPKSRISTIVGSASYTQNKQFIMPVLSNIWTRNNNYTFVGDYRFYQYPQSTYGLGSNSNIKAEDPMDFSFFRFYETVLRHITGNWYAGAGYAIDTYWKISHQMPKNGAPSDYEAYGTSARSISSGIGLSVLHDSRDNSLNPFKGWFVNMQYRINNKTLGSTRNWESLIVDLRKYTRFPANSDNVLALWSYNWLVVNGNPPYLDLPSTSWDPNTATGRGYIQGRFRGARMHYLESEYRFKITRNGLIGGVLFANAQTLSAEPGTRLQRIQPGYGSGLRIKLNKTSRTNIAIDYGFGKQGSRGLFIDVGEIF